MTQAAFDSPEPNRPRKLQLPSIRDLSLEIKLDTYELCHPDGRMVGSKGHQRAEAFVRRRLEEAGCIPFRGDLYDLPYSGRHFEFTNFAGIIPGRDSNLAPLLIGAHYDSVIAAPCADDNGGSVSACLAVAKILKQNGGLNRDVIIAIFDGEEPPNFQGPDMGSHRFYDQQLDWRGVHFALIHDMISHDVSLPIGSFDLPMPVLKNALFMMGAESHPALPRAITTADIPRGLKLGATLNEYVGDMSDHGVFRRNGVPYLFCSCGLWAHYHQLSDTPDRLNYKKAARVVQLSCRLLEKIDNEPLDQTDCEDDHTLSFEITTLRRLTGPALPLILKAANLKKVTTREDLDKVIRLLMSLGISY